MYEKNSKSQAASQRPEGHEGPRPSGKIDAGELPEELRTTPLSSSLSASDTAPEIDPAELEAEGDGPKPLLTKKDRKRFFWEVEERLKAERCSVDTYRRKVSISYGTAQTWCADRGTNVRARDALWTIFGAPAGWNEETGKAYGTADLLELRFDRARKVLFLWTGEGEGAHWSRDTSGRDLLLFEPVRAVLEYFKLSSHRAAKEIAEIEEATLEALQSRVDGAEAKGRSKLEREVNAAREDFKAARERLLAMAGPFQRMLEKCSNTFFQTESLKQAWSGDRGLGDSGESWDAFDTVRNTIPVGNGILTIGEAGVQIRPGHPSDRFLMRTEVGYHRNARGTAWRQFVLSLFGGDEELSAWFQEVVGGALLRGGNGLDPQAYFLYGAGSNGKTTLLHVLHAALGDLYIDANPALLLDRNLIDSPNGPTPALFELMGRAIMAMEELKTNVVLDPAQLKRLCAGTELSARAPHSPVTVHFRTTATPFIGTNNLPRLKEFDHGILRRIKCIPFTQQFVSRSKAPAIGKTGSEPAPGPGLQWADEGIEYKLRAPAELQGVLMWAVEGAVRVARRGRIAEPPEVVSRVTSDWVEGENGLSLFLHDRLLSHADEKDGARWYERAKDVYEAYSAWCGQNGVEHPLSVTSFFKRLYSMSDRNTGKKLFAADRTNTERRVLFAELVGAVRVREGRSVPLYGEQDGDQDEDGGGWQ